MGSRGSDIPPDSHPTRLSSVVDLERYPFHDRDSTIARALVARCRADLDREGVCNLPGFLRAAAIDALVAEAERALSLAHRSDDTHTVTFDKPPEQPQPDDPQGLLQHSSKLTLAWDRVEADSPLRTLYAWDALTDVLAEVLGLPRLHRYDDTLGACSLALFEPGDELGWHVDRSDFAVTLMLQPALVGGSFEHVPGLDPADPACVQELLKVLCGDGGNIQRLEDAPGTLTLFRGHRSLHRVTPVGGDRIRVNAVLAYADEPHARMNALTQQLFYGRTAPSSAGLSGS